MTSSLRPGGADSASMSVIQPYLYSCVASSSRLSVLELIESEELRNTKGAAGLVRSAEDRFDGEFIHATFEATYKELIADYV
jgi:hypothetical protein